MKLFLTFSQYLHLLLPIDPNLLYYAGRTVLATDRREMADMYRRAAALFVLVAMLMGYYGLWARKNAQGTSRQIVLVANSNGCYGAGCNGKDPSGLCADGITVASQAVTDGLLELRYSPSCSANWGRYTPWRRDAISYFMQGKGIFARVTAWNPDSHSYGTAHHDTTWNNFGSSWSQMVDGTKAACVGVEVVITGDNGDYESQGWNWGPCY